MARKIGPIWIILLIGAILFIVGASMPPYSAGGGIQILGILILVVGVFILVCQEGRAEDDRRTTGTTRPDDYFGGYYGHVPKPKYTLGCLGGFVISIGAAVVALTIFGSYLNSGDILIYFLAIWVLSAVCCSGILGERR